MTDGAARPETGMTSAARQGESTTGTARQGEATPGTTRHGEGTPGTTRHGEGTPGTARPEGTRTGAVVRSLRGNPRRGWPNAVRGEVLKLVTLPALWIAVGLTWAVTLLVRAAAPAGSAMAFGQVGFLVLGALAATHEHQSGGQFRTTLLAVPRRPVLAVARTVALAVTAAPVALVVAGTAGEPAGAGFLVLDALLAAGVGTIVRHPVGTVAVLLTASQMALPMARGRFADLAPWLPEHNAAAPVWTAVIVLAATAVLVRREA